MIKVDDEVYDEEEDYEGQAEVDALWSKYVGSRRIFGNNELSILRRLKKEKVIAWEMLYAMYLTSKHWRALRYKVLKRDNYKCVLCNKKDKHMHVDHLSYKGFGKEKMEDLQTLCKECHQKKSGFEL